MARKPAMQCAASAWRQLSALLRWPDRSSALVRGALCATWLGLGACSSDEPAPRWISLAEAPGAAAYVEQSEGRWFRTEVPRDAFKPGLVPGFWSLPDPFANSDLPIDHEVAPVIEVDGQELAFRDHLRLNEEFLELLKNIPDSGAFFFFNQKLHVALPPPRQLPESVQLRAFVNADSLSSGRARTRTRLTVHDGFSIFPESPLELHADLPENAALSFSLAALAPFEITGEEEPSQFTIHVDGTEVFSLTTTPSRLLQSSPQRIMLPSAAHAKARWRFEAKGAPALWSVASPVVGPAQVGAPGARPWPSEGEAERPNLIVFLADTLRADALSIYGGEADVTPNLDAFAAASATFTRAWSPSSWTLPSHASLFSGVFPYQHGARRQGTRFGTGLETLGERFASAGYRTGAVTDGLFVSRRWGLDRGFESFRENAPASLDATLAGVREFLDADDGRPFLLFVQSYHAHGPYFLRPETVELVGERLGIRDTWEELMLRSADVLRTEGILKTDGPGLDPEALFSMLQESQLGGRVGDLMASFKSIYLARVFELDQAFGKLLDDLEQRTLRDSSYFVFTSDHGEAFGEHGKVFHGSGVWDEVLRVPLLVAGPSVEPGTRSFGASLIDIAPTLADAASVEPAPTWIGSSLLSLDRDRPVFAFDCAHNSAPLATWVEGAFKVGVTLDPADPESAPQSVGSLEYLYNLEADPGELTNLAGSGSAQGLERFDDLSAAMQALLRPLDMGASAELDDNMRARLQKMGYAD